MQDKTTVEEKKTTEEKTASDPKETAENTAGTFKKEDAADKPPQKSGEPPKNDGEALTKTEKTTKDDVRNKKELIKEALYTMMIVFISIFVNLIGNSLTHTFDIPLWLDSFGTILAAYTLGPICGAIVGASSNIIFSFWSGSSPLYALTSVFIGLSIGYASRKRYFDTLFHTMSVAGFVTIISVVLSSTLNIVFNNGNTDNIWGDGVRDYLMSNNVPYTISAFIGQLYLEFADKLLTVMSLFFVVKLIRAIRKRLCKNDETKDAHKAAKHAAAFLLVTAAAFAIGTTTPFSAYAEEVSSTDTEKTSYIRTIYNADNGLPCGHANDVIQTNDGILWVGSYSGLYRYNGTTFRFMDEFDTVKNVNCLFVDAEGRLWIGTNDNGVCVSIHERVTETLGSADGLPSDSVKCITESSSGEYYIGTADKMVVVELNSGITITKTLDDILFANHASADLFGNVATVTAQGKLYILKDGEISFEIKEDDDTVFTTCSFKENGELWAGTSDGKVFIYTIKDNAPSKPAVIECGELNGINCIYMQDDKTAWILSDSGVGTITNNKDFEFFETEGFNFSLENMTTDYQGNLWIASSRMGLMQLSAAVFTDIFGDYGLEGKVVNTTELRNDMLYIGTDDGLIILDRKNKQQVTNELTDLLENSRIRCIKTDLKNNLWLCTYGKGLVELRQDGTIKSYDSDEIGIGSRVRVCLELKNGQIAVGGDKALYFIKDEKVVDKLIYGEDLGAAKILCLLQLPDGKLLAGSDGNGIAILENNKLIGELTRENGLTSDVILRMVLDNEDNSVFIATGNSICHYSGNTVKPLNNFPYSNNYDIILDNDGEIFVPGSSGIYVMDKKALLRGGTPEYMILNSKSGLRGSLTSNAWNVTDKKKNIYLSTDRGVFTVNMDSYKTQRRFYRLMISKMLLDGNEVNTKRGSVITVSKDTQSVEFIPEIVNYTLEEPTISYYLEGLDNEWKQVSQKDLSRIVYTNLPSGDYRFRLAVIEPETNVILEESTYVFKKETAIYENTWFIVYMVIVGFLFVGWLTWFISRTQYERSMEIQKTKLDFALKQIQMGNQTILAIAKTVDAKDVRTSQHSQRVSDYSVMIAEKYGFSHDQLENLRKAALLHDIGKIGIPDAILNKPARLTDEEYAIMKTHVTRGAAILKDFTIIDHVVDGARYHHERYDGRGYPDGLSGKDIPLYGRIISIADAFDAMTANRVYRKKQDFGYVMSELHKGRGTQFDPELLDIFLGLIDSGEIDIDKLYATDDQSKNDSGEAK